MLVKYESVIPSKEQPAAKISDLIYSEIQKEVVIIKQLSILA